MWDNVYPSQKRIRGRFFGAGICPRDENGIFEKKRRGIRFRIPRRLRADKKQKKRDPVDRYGKNRKTDNTEVSLTDTGGSSTRPDVSIKYVLRPKVLIKGTGGCFSSGVQRGKRGVITFRSPRSVRACVGLRRDLPRASLPRAPRLPARCRVARRGAIFCLGPRVPRAPRRWL
jgi:hypothetical protein